MRRLDGVDLSLTLSKTEEAKRLEAGRRALQELRLRLAERRSPARQTWGVRRRLVVLTGGLPGAPRHLAAARRSRSCALCLRHRSSTAGISAWRNSK